MKSKIKKLEGTSRQLEIEMPKTSVDEAYNEIYIEMQRTAEIPGFRKGKAPMDIIIKNYGREAKDEVMRRLVPRGYQEALEYHKLTPVSFPEIDEVNLSLSGVLAFKATLDIHPEVDLKKYREIKVTTEKIIVTEEEKEEALKRMRNMYADFVTVERAAQKGDFTRCDVTMFVDGKQTGKKRENMWIEVDKEASIFGIGEELCGMKANEEKSIDFTVPEDYQEKKYAGKKLNFHIVLKDVREKKLPELNEEFAKKAGKDKIEDIKEEIDSWIKESKETDSKVKMKNQIVAYLLEKHSFDLPVSMVKRQLKVLMERAEEELLQKGVSEENIKGQGKELEERLKKEAENKVKLYFILAAIAEEEKVHVTEDEVSSWIETLAASYNQPVEKVKKYYEEHDLIEGVREQLREEKTLDFVLTQAVITVK